MAAPGGGQGRQDVSAVQERLVKLDTDADRVAEDIKAAFQDLRAAQSDDDRAICRQRYDDLKADKQNLDQRRAALESQLAAAARQPVAPAGVLKHPKLAFGDETIEAAYSRMSRVELGNECIGCVSRITDKGLCVGAYHVHVDEAGKYLTATAFGHDLQLLAGFPYYDLIFLQGPPGPAFEWTRAGMYVPAQEVMLLAHPRATERDLKTKEPHESHGRITLVAVTQEVAAADYHGAMPNSSGGSVLFNSNSFAGVHLGTSYHLDDTHQKDQPEQSADVNRIDTDPDNMWVWGSDKGQGGSKKRRSSAGSASREAIEDAMERLCKMAMHSIANIRHKDQVALFVPAPFVAQLAARARLIGADALHWPVSMLSNRS